MGRPRCDRLEAATATLVAGSNPYQAGTWNDLPLALVLAAPSQWLVSHPYYAQVLAMTAAGAFLSFARPGRVSGISAALLFLVPQELATGDTGRGDAFVMFLLAVVLYCAGRLPRLLPFVLGLLLASRLHLVLLLPAAVVFNLVHPSPRAVLAAAAKTLATFALVVVPFIVWSPAAFFGALSRQAQASAAPLAATWLGAAGVAHGPAWLGVVAGVLAVALVMVRAARTPSGFAAGLALLSLCCFLFGQTADLGAYTLVLVALLAAVGVTGLAGQRQA